MVGGLIEPLPGFISDRIGKRMLLVIIVLLGMVICFSLISSFGGGVLVLALAFLGLAVAFVQLLQFALPPEILIPKDTALGFGILTACTQLGIVAGTFLTGLVIDATYDLGSPLFTIAFFSWAAVIFSLVLKAR